MVDAVAGAITMASAHKPKSTWLFQVPSRCAKNSLMTGLLVSANKVMEACQQFVEKNDREPVVACMGLAFKPNIDDLRESPAKYIASRIVSESRAEVLIVEPNVASHASFHLTDYREAYKKADIVVWLVRHTPFVELPREEGKLELDFCGVRK